MYAIDGNKYLVRDIDGSLGNKGKTIAVTFDDDLKVADVDGDVCVSSTDYEITDDRLGCFCRGHTVYACQDSVCTSDLESSLKCRRDACVPTDSVKQASCAAGKYYFDANSQKIYLCTESEGVTCEAQDGSNVPTGYFINAAVGNEQYIQCNGATCKIVGSTPASNCSGKKTGDLIYVTEQGYRLCTGSGPVAITNGDQFLIKLEDSSDNAFTQSYTNSNSIIIKVTDGNIVLETATPTDGNYIVNTDKKIVTEAGGVTLVQCSNGDGTCDTPSPLPVGYLKNALATTHTDVPYISCNNFRCEAISAESIVDTSSCVGKNAGDIIETSQGNFALCVDSTLAPLALSAGSTTIKYMVKADKNATTNPFKTVAPDESDYYIVVKVTGTDVVVNTQDKKKYRYANASQRIYESKDEKGASSNVCKIPGGVIVEYTVNYCSSGKADAYDYYAQGDPHTWTN
ncbi:hypothetical protein PIROE2DRAFT_57202 [Piromyces sp. E2]|nr:hypothetical protein PIROE2DRAFT_57202 [Piromyces sp. E2]|eukprot:OUM69770.1 hypothetical protein PIROE2DRAFT_57202 [Piromyces sp. E2]